MPIMALRRIRPYLIAILSVFLALQTKWLIQPYISSSPPFITFLAAIMVTAWYGGFRPAVFATVLSAVAIDYYIIHPSHSFLTTLPDLGTLTLFGVISLSASYAIHHLQSARHAAVAFQKRLEHLHDFSRRLLNEEGFEPMLQSVLQASLVLLGGNKGMIQLYDAEENTLAMAAHVGFNQEGFPRQFQHVSLNFSSCGAAFQRKERVTIEDVATDTTFSDFVALTMMSEGVSAQSTPLFRPDGSVFGVLTTYHAKPSFPSDGDFRLLDLYARQAERVLEAKYKEEELRQANVDLAGHLHALVGELAATEERERRDLASELHDYLAQLLTLGQLKLRLAQRFIKHSPGKSERYILETAEAIGHSLDYARTLMVELCPQTLYDAGLPAAVQWLATQMTKHGLTVGLNMTSDSLELPHDRAVLLYKSIRELLMNVVKHAMVDRATVSIRLDSNNTLVIEVQDEGQGFDTSLRTPNDTRVHFGLASVRERMTVMGGWCHTKSAIGRGTTITLGLPLHQQMDYDISRAASALQQDRVKTNPTVLSGQEQLPWE